jgi:predicted lactoylglutathione lyase
MIFVPDQEIADEGRPGDQGGIFYATYFQDIDGNKLNTVFLGS